MEDVERPPRCRGTTIFLDSVATTADAMSVDFDLVPTDVCWKNVAGIECGEPSDPESETGMCSKHRAEVRKRWSKN